MMLNIKFSMNLAISILFLGNDYAVLENLPSFSFNFLLQCKNATKLKWGLLNIYDMELFILILQIK